MTLANASWPTDPKWRAFAARIADGVTQHINRGGKIAACTDDECGLDCRCPFGALHPAPYPSIGMSAKRLELPITWARGFIRGFDGLTPGGHEASFRLGQEYRRRFTTEAV